jgi:YVTN family beta-propeller protein
VTVDSLQRIDPSTNDLVATFPAGNNPVGIAAGEGFAWVASESDNTVTQIDAETDTVTSVLSGDAPTALVVAGGFLWILEDDTSIHQLDPATGAVGQTLELKEIEAGPGLLAAGPDSVWGAILCRCGDPNSPESHHGVVEIRLDPGALYSPDSPNVRKIDVARAAPTAIAVGESAVWVANDYAAFAEVVRYDPTTGSLAETIQVEGGASGIAAGEGAVWVVNPLSDTVSRIDATTNAIVERIPVGDNPLEVAVGEGSVWVTNYRDGTVSRIDPATNAVVETIEVGPKPNHIAVGEGGVWVTVHSR